jgi:hypothetical protein
MDQRHQAALPQGRHRMVPDRPPPTSVANPLPHAAGAST